MKHVIKIKAKVKENNKKKLKNDIITRKEFFKLISDYAADKYGVIITESSDYLFVRDMVCGSSYNKDLVDTWYNKYCKDGNKEIYKDEVDLLLYMQLLQMFFNMFGEKTDSKFYS